MKKFLFTLFMVLLVPIILLAQIADPVLSLPDAFAQAMGLLTSGKLAGLSGVAIIVQVLMLVARTHLVDFAGKWRLSIVLFLTVVLGVLTLMVGGLTFWSSLLHATTLAALQVLGHQLYKNFTEKPKLS